VVLLSDGRVTGGKSLAEAAEMLTRQEQDADGKIPVHALTFGADHPLRDLRIDEVKVPPEASLGDLLTFRVKITNYIRHSLSLDLTVSENGKEIRRRRVRWSRMGPQEVVVHTVPETEGEREFHFALPLFDDEINTDNNEAKVTVKVVKRGLRVLVIAGRPTLEYHYLVPALLRDPIVKLSCYLQSGDVDYTHQGNAGIDRLPRTTREWNTFDVIVLADVDPKGLSSRQVSGLEALVRKGGGLVVIAGRCFGLDMLLQVHPTKLSEMLPVRIDKNRHPDYNRLFTGSFRGARTPAGAGHPVLIAAPDGRINERIWSTFPDFYWHHPVEDLKRGGVVLLEKRASAAEEAVPPPTARARGRILMAIRRYGEGAVFYSGLNSLWRWRYPCESYDYDRFWTRVVRYLGETRLLGAQKQVSLTTDQAVYAPGEQVTVILRILDAALMEQLRDERVFVTVTGAAGGRLAVELSADAAGLPEYRGLYDAQHLGRGLIHARHVSSKADTIDDPAGHGSPGRGHTHRPADHPQG